MCELFSFNVTKDGKVLAVLDGLQDYYYRLGYSLPFKPRTKALKAKENPDSHSYISELFGVDDDSVWKYEMTNFEAKDLGEIIDSLSYDGGLPEEDIPLSCLHAIESFFKDHLEVIKENIALTQKGVLDFVGEILALPSGNYVFNPDALLADENVTHPDGFRDWLINILADHGFRIENDNYYFRKGDLERIVIYWRDNGTQIVDFITVVSYIHKYVENDEIKSERRITIYPAHDPEE